MCATVVLFLIDVEAHRRRLEVVVVLWLWRAHGNYIINTVTGNRSGQDR